MLAGRNDHLLQLDFMEEKDRVNITANEVLTRQLGART